MCRRAAFAIAAVVGLLLTGCYGPFGQSGVSVPNAVYDAQTVSDAADALLAHRSSATDNARAAIGVTNGIGSFIRDINRDELAISQASRRSMSRSSAQLARPTGGRIYTASQLVIRPAIANVAPFCESGAGMGLNGIASLDASFGWQSGTYAGGTRTSNGGDFATWSATATGASVEAPIGQLGIMRHGGTSCPMTDPTYTINGARAGDGFSIPISLTYQSGRLWDVTASGGTFNNGERLDMSSTSSTGRIAVSGIITKNETELGSFAENAAGDGTLTVTSTGAQYRIKDWIVVGI
jgi:hypothetical protein